MTNDDDHVGLPGKIIHMPAPEVRYDAAVAMALWDLFEANNELRRILAKYEPNVRHCGLPKPNTARQVALAKEALRGPPQLISAR